MRQNQVAGRVRRQTGAYVWRQTGGIFKKCATLMDYLRHLISRPEATFMLRVEGDSMVDAGILPGDTVLVERGRTPRNGDIVIACVDAAWTMKYFFKV